MARLSAASGAAVLGVAYRLAPEHHFPAPLEDALAAYDWALQEVEGPSRVAFAGDSAGGGLALSALMSLRDARRELPAACLLLSPWTDLTAGGESYASRAGSDPIHQRPMILAMARSYLGPEADPRDPRASPLHGDLSGLPPLLIQVGDRETVLDDSTRLAAAAERAGVPVRLEVWDDMIHVFQLFAAELPEAAQAIAGAGAFLHERLFQPYANDDGGGDREGRDRGIGLDREGMAAYAWPS
jgi:acetyl esterase/lipase